MKNISNEVLRFRLVLQDLWNNYCWRSEDLRTIESMDEFESLKLSIYHFFVLGLLTDVPSTTQIFGPAFIVVPQLNENGDRKATLEMRIDTADAASGHVWTPEVHEINEKEIRFEIVDFFDWRIFHWRDYRYFRVTVTKWDSKPSVVGRQALLDALTVDVLFDEDYFYKTHHGRPN